MLRIKMNDDCTGMAQGDGSCVENQNEHSTAPEAENEKLFIYIINPAAEISVSVAGIDMRTRWSKTFTHLELKRKPEPVFVNVHELKDKLATAESPLLLADGNWVLEPLAIETFLESCADENDAASLTMFATKRGTAPLIKIGVEACKALAEQWNASSESPVFELIKTARETRIACIREKIFDKAFFWSRPENRTTAKDAEWGLLQRLQWRPGGLVAQLLNRPVSIRMSRVVASMPITPNQTTIIAFLIGLAGIYFLFTGSYVGAIAGMLLIQLNSIVDGVDGELANLRHQRSEFGGYLDSICDELLNTLLYISCGYYLSRNGYGPAYVYLGLLAGLGSFAYALIHWHCKLKHGLGFYWWWDAYKPRKRIQREMTPYFYLRKLFCKDSIILLFLFAVIFGFLHWLVWAAAIAASCAVILLFIHIFIKRARW